MTAGALSPEQLQQRLGSLVEERLGLRFHEGNFDLLKQGLGRLGATGANAAAALHAELERSALTQPVWQRLIAEITVGETYFFRHPEDFAVLRRHVVPALLEAGHTHLRAWSAGCATGEEAYSLAICLSSAAPQASVEVLGTDLNQGGLAVAQRGSYGARSLRGAVPVWESALLPGPGGQCQLPLELRNRVRFAVHNLADPGSAPPMGPAACQVIFCRNVLIYFGQSGAAQVLTRLAQSLAPGGYLFVSPLDVTHCVAELDPLELDGIWLFRKTPPRPAASPRPRPHVSSPPPPAEERKAPPEYPDPVRQARLAADRGDLRTATQIARQALRNRRTPEALHLLALILGEQNQHEEMRQLLEEAITQDPSYVQGHLSLGLLPSPGSYKRRAARHLSAVLSLLAARAEDEVLPGPEPLSVTLARRLAQQGLENLYAGEGLPTGEREPRRHQADGDSR